MRTTCSGPLTRFTKTRFECKVWGPLLSVQGGGGVSSLLQTPSEWASSGVHVWGHARLTVLQYYQIAARAHRFRNRLVRRRAGSPCTWERARAPFSGHQSTSRDAVWSSCTCRMWRFERRAGEGGEGQRGGGGGRRRRRRRTEKTDAVKNKNDKC